MRQSSDGFKFSASWLRSCAVYLFVLANLGRGHELQTNDVGSEVREVGQVGFPSLDVGNPGRRTLSGHWLAFAVRCWNRLNRQFNDFNPCNDISKGIRVRNSFQFSV